MRKIEQSIVIDAPLAAVWEALTRPELMKQWMGEPEMEIEVSTDWTVGSPIVITGFHHASFENRGTVLQFEPMEVVRYSFLSSLSRLPDTPESYSELEFRLQPFEDDTSLTVIVTGFPTESIFKHLDFYWRGTIHVLKRFLEEAMRHARPAVIDVFLSALHPRTGGRRMFYLKVAIATLGALALWVFLMVWGAASGWWREPLAPSGDSEAFMRAAVDHLGRNPGNAAMVLIEDGKVVGEHYAGQDPVNRDTVFAVASLSKWLAAWGVMVLVQDGRVDLDRPVSDYLTRWKLPESQFDHQGVTVRRLLSHTAGLTDGLGWGDYRPDERVPTLEQSLADPRGAAGEDVAIAVGRPPGSEWDYSGGGYLILELLVEEVSGRPFDAFMREAVFQPLGMSRSSYEYLGDIESSAKSYDRSGKPAPIYRHASKAATALNTSAGDLTLFALAQLSNVSGRPLTQDSIDAMRAPHASAMGADLWGLGVILYAPTDSGDFVFGHDGRNDPAISATARVNPDTGDAIVALTTGSHGASELGAHWVFWQTGRPDVLSVGREVQRVMPVTLGGTLVIVVVAVVLAWRRRRRVAAPAA